MEAHLDETRGMSTGPSVTTFDPIALLLSALVAKAPGLSVVSMVMVGVEPVPREVALVGGQSQ